MQLLPLYRIEPQDILPAKETLLSVCADRGGSGTYQKTFPALDDVISDATLDAVAIVNIANETQSVGFVRKSEAWDGTSCEVGSYVIIRAETTFPLPQRY